jgi:hypothetical protein
MANGASRDGRREVQWRRVVQEQRGSGLTIREFCRKRNLPESAFYFWRRELQRRQAEQGQRPRHSRRSRGRASSPQATFVPVRLAEETPPQAHRRIEIELSGGRRIHVVAPVDRAALADVLAVLEGRPC